MDFIRIIIPAFIITGLAVIGLAVNLLLRKGGKFPNTHVSGNRHMKARGISCIQEEDRKEQKHAREKADYKNLTWIRKP